MPGKYMLMLEAAKMHDNAVTIGDRDWQQAQGFEFRVGENLVVFDAIQGLLAEASKISMNEGRIALVQYLKLKGLIEMDCAWCNDYKNYPKQATHFLKDGRGSVFGLCDVHVEMSRKSKGN